MPQLNPSNTGNNLDNLDNKKNTILTLAPWVKACYGGGRKLAVSFGSGGYGREYIHRFSTLDIAAGKFFTGVSVGLTARGTPKIPEPPKSLILFYNRNHADSDASDCKKKQTEE